MRSRYSIFYAALLRKGVTNGEKYDRMTLSIYHI